MIVPEPIYDVKTRSTLLPDIPTVAETGLPGFDAVLTYGIVAPGAVAALINDLLAGFVIGRDASDPSAVYDDLYDMMRVRHAGGFYEDAIAGINGVKRVQSRSTDSLAVVGIELRLEVDAQNAAAEVREKVAAIRGRLPKDINDPTIVRFDVSALPIMTAGMCTLPLVPFITIGPPLVL